MTGYYLKNCRRQSGWTQVRLAARLGVTQAYVSLMEQGKRPVPDRIARVVIRLLQLPATVLPLPASTEFDRQVTEQWIAEGLARLGYPGFAYLDKPGVKRNPVEILLKALVLDDLEPRLAEALSWLLLEFEELDVKTLVSEAKKRELQNRLGFTISLARLVADHNPAYRHRSRQLQKLEEMVEPSRLAREDTYGRKETSERMSVWVRENRSEEANHWNLLTDLKMDHLPYAG
ncbi:MAG: helix-turn-helix domain-containing protein [Candidatus Glassbacteria bacterium]